MAKKVSTDILKYNNEKLLNNIGNGSVDFISNDSTSATEYITVDALITGGILSSLFNKVSTMIKNIRYLYSMVTTLNIDFNTLYDKITNMDNWYLAYAKTDPVTYGDPFVQVTVPYAGDYLLIGYVCTNGSADSAAWLNYQTDPNTGKYDFLKIQNYCSFAKIMWASQPNLTYHLVNANQNSTTVAPYRSMYIGLILLNKY